MFEIDTNTHTHTHTHTRQKTKTKKRRTHSKEKRTGLGGEVEEDGGAVGEEVLVPRPVEVVHQDAEDAEDDEAFFGVGGWVCE